MGNIEKIENVDPKKLIPYTNNAKIHNDMQLEKIKESIKSFGFITPCLIDKDFNIIAGHGRVMAALELELEDVPCVFLEGLSENQKKAYILADNKLSELADWNMELIDKELAQLAAEGFDISLTGFGFSNQIKQEINEGIEIDLDFFGDEKFKYECPECGFKFN